MQTTYENELIAHDDHVIRPGEIVIEIDQEHVSEFRDPELRDVGGGRMRQFTKIRKVVSGNANQYFEPAGRLLRSRIIIERSGVMFDFPRVTRNIDYIPGERIHLDLEKGIGRITDALFDPENVELLDHIQSCAMQLPFPGMLQPGLDKQGFQPHEERFLDEYARWNWIFWMRRIVDEGCRTEGERRCRPIQNVEHLPTIEECIRSRRVPISVPAPVAAQFQREMEKKDPEYFSSRPVLIPEIYGLPDKPNRN